MMSGDKKSTKYFYNQEAANYKKMYEAMKNSMDKQRIGKLITELEKDINEGEKDDERKN